MAPSRASQTAGRKSRESYSLEGGSGQQPRSRSQLPVDEEDGFQSSPRKSRWSKFLHGMTLEYLMRRKNRHSYPYEALKSDSGAEGKTEHDCKPPPHPSRRTTTTTTAWALAKQACLIIPVLTLMLFGLLHVLQVLIGRASLLWDLDHDNFLPNWGKPGHQGEGLGSYPTDATRDVTPVPVHSHNDYWRRIPLFEALHYGCIGVEADVWHFDDELYVGHNTAALTRNRTFRSLYVDPIVALLDTMNPQTGFSNTTKHGVFDTNSGQTLVLLVDLKTDGPTTLPVVEQQLEGLRSKGYLTHFNGTHTVPGAVTVVGTGNTPFNQLIANTTYRDIFYDAPLDKLWENPRTYVKADINEDGQVEVDTDYGTLSERQSEKVGRGPGNMLKTRGQGETGLDADTPASAFNTETSYYASVDFRATVGFVFRGHLTPRQVNIIRGQIRGAKNAGLKARYWNTPVWPISLRNHIWHVLVREGADMLNADDLQAASTQDWRRWRHEWW